MRDYLKGHVGAWAPRQPQWQHWGELAAVGQGVAPTAYGTGAAPEGGSGPRCGDEGATEREETIATDADACMVAGGWVGWLQAVVVVVVASGGGGGGSEEGSEERESGDGKWLVRRRRCC